MRTKAEKIAVYTAKKKGAEGRIKMLHDKIAATNAVIKKCNDKIASAMDDEPIVIVEKKA